MEKIKPLTVQDLALFIGDAMNEADVPLDKFDAADCEDLAQDIFDRYGLKESE